MRQTILVRTCDQCGKESRATEGPATPFGGWITMSMVTCDQSADLDFCGHDCLRTHIAVGWLDQLSSRIAANEALLINEQDCITYTDANDKIRAYSVTRDLLLGSISLDTTVCADSKSS